MCNLQMHTLVRGCIIVITAAHQSINSHHMGWDHRITPLASIDVDAAVRKQQGVNGDGICRNCSYAVTLQMQWTEF